MYQFCLVYLLNNIRNIQNIFKHIQETINLLNYITSQIGNSSITRHTITIYYLRAWSVGFMYFPLLVVFMLRRPILKCAVEIHLGEKIYLTLDHQRCDVLGWKEKTIVFVLWFSHNALRRWGSCVFRPVPRLTRFPFNWNPTEHMVKYDVFPFWLSLLSCFESTLENIIVLLCFKYFSG